jgi:hypothetical protein
MGWLKNSVGYVAGWCLAEASGRIISDKTYIRLDRKLSTWRHGEEFVRGIEALAQRTRDENVMMDIRTNNLPKLKTARPLEDGDGFRINPGANRSGPEPLRVRAGFVDGELIVDTEACHVNDLRELHNADDMWVDPNYLNNNYMIPGNLGSTLLFEI